VNAETHCSYIFHLSAGGLCWQQAHVRSFIRLQCPGLTITRRTRRAREELSKYTARTLKIYEYKRTQATSLSSSLFALAREHNTTQRRCVFANLLCVARDEGGLERERQQNYLFLGHANRPVESAASETFDRRPRGNPSSP
jgi:hypothetical protein